MCGVQLQVLHTILSIKGCCYQLSTMPQDTQRPTVIMSLLSILSASLICCCYRYCWYTQPLVTKGLHTPHHSTSQHSTGHAVGHQGCRPRSRTTQPAALCPAHPITEPAGKVPAEAEYRPCVWKGIGLVLQQKKKEQQAVGTWLVDS